MGSTPPTEEVMKLYIGDLCLKSNILDMVRAFLLDL